MVKGEFQRVLFGLIYCGIDRMWPLYALWFKEVITVESCKPLIGVGRSPQASWVYSARKPGRLEYACDVTEWLQG